MALVSSLLPPNPIYSLSTSLQCSSVRRRGSEPRVVFLRTLVFRPNSLYIATKVLIAKKETKFVFVCLCVCVCGLLLLVWPRCVLEISTKRQSVHTHTRICLLFRSRICVCVCVAIERYDKERVLFFFYCTVVG